MRKKVSIAVIIGLIIGLGLFFILQNKSQAPADTLESSQAQEEVVAATFTKEQVAEHATKTDCWTIISDTVYDITQYIPRHPGGDEILRACGTDGTTLFTGRVTASGEAIGSGEPHSSSAQSALNAYKIGTVSQ